jgi:hypothetical protein
MRGVCTDDDDAFEQPVAEEEKEEELRSHEHVEAKIPAVRREQYMLYDTP